MKMMSATRVLVAWLALSTSYLCLALPQTASNDYDEDYEETNDIPEEHARPLEIPNFVSESGTVYVKEGERLKLNCKVDDLGVFIIFWQRGKDIISVGEKKMNLDSRIHLRTLPDKRGMSLAIDNFNSETDKGEYNCTIASEPTKSLTFVVKEMSEKPPPEEVPEVKNDEIASTVTAAASKHTLGTCGLVLLISLTFSKLLH